MTMVREEQVCKRRLAEVLRPFGKPRHLQPRLLPERRSLATHEKRPEVLGGPGEAEEVLGFEESEYLHGRYSP